MKILLAILFPWQATFKQAGLHKRWWHRLAGVLFFVVILVVLSFSWVFAFASFQPQYSKMPAIEYWEMNTDGDLRKSRSGRQRRKLSTMRL
jgi:hypothetical protein